MESILIKLSEVKTKINPIKKTSTNPFFKSRFFDINELISNIEPLLEESRLLLLQPIKENKVFSIIYHIDSGESVESSLELPNLTDPQKLGSAITYFRRYTLQSLLGLQAEDDDGNSASKQVKQQLKPTLSTEQFESSKKGTKEQINTVLSKFNMTVEQRKELQKLV
mgnify:CR=1 FL=1